MVDFRRRVPLSKLNRSRAAALIKVLYHVDAWSLHAELPQEEPTDDDGHGLDLRPGGGPGGNAGDDVGARGPTDAADGSIGKGAGRDARAAAGLLPASRAQQQAVAAARRHRGARLDTCR